ncbi:hypothetical protein [Peribacillus frigoritolerans]|uniref:hypothetical protein n=1 Tax=Peribacillus frigoritolerans TaxID=450367 RepID=UPI0010598290|nr:hypothetical protein [Peribacillus frigoritolerans]TDL80966.1 hypothetical protein E2R53_13410 [Peribacillus frigoritolerans]
MLDLKTYTEQELALELGIAANSLRRTYKITLKDYIHSDRYKVSKGIYAYDIINYKEVQKSDFIKVCEQVAGRIVSFPREKNAEKLLRFLFEDDQTILSNEKLGENINMERHTVSKYMKLFQKYGILESEKKKIPSITFDAETGELYSKEKDFNKYTYYKVLNSQDILEEISEDDYQEMIDFIHKIKSDYVSENLFYCHSDEAIKALYKNAKIAAQLECKEEYGALPRKAFTKIPSKKAYEHFSSYFDIPVRTEKDYTDIIDFLNTEDEDPMRRIYLEHTVISFNHHSVIGKDPEQRDWDDFPDDEEISRAIELEKLHSEINYFSVLRFSNKKLTDSQRNGIDKLLYVLRSRESALNTWKKDVAA